MKSANNRIFLLSTERSGSNLMRAIMGSHQDIVAPSPAHLLHFFIPLLPAYGDLKKVRNVKHLASDMITYLKTKVMPWTLDVDIDQIVSENNVNSFMSLFDCLYASVKEEENYIFFKEIEMDKHFKRIEHYYSEPKYIYLVRDPRDVVLSAIKSTNHLYSLEEYAIKWAHEQNTFIEFLMREGSDKIKIIHYEDLLSYPVIIIKEICKFIGVPYDDKMLSFYKKKQFKREAKNIKNWENLGANIIQNNYFKYKKALTNSQIKKIEALTFRELRLMGYPLENSINQVLDKRNNLERNRKIKRLLFKFSKGRFISYKELKNRRESTSFYTSLYQKRMRELKPIAHLKVLEKN